MGWRALTPSEKAAHENSLRKLAEAAATVVSKPVPVAVLASVTVEAVVETAVEALSPEDGHAVEWAADAKPAGKNPFKKKP